MRTPYGQNFLVSAPAAQRIAEALHSTTDDSVIEIGPGRGALTQTLIPLCAALTVVELDQTLADLLVRRWGHEPKLTVVSDDFMNWPLPPAGDRRFQVIGNLPYSAAAAIVQKVLAWEGWGRAVFMVQKEVGVRMTAVPGEKRGGCWRSRYNPEPRCGGFLMWAPGPFALPQKSCRQFWNSSVCHTPAFPTSTLSSRSPMPLLANAAKRWPIACPMGWDSAVRWSRLSCKN
ncbi:MAG: hypothetical protein IPN90_00190 [Elusimicrobia bacterium]|nr:hypothetical protein [Elusimicrobiota bacterium]